MYITVSYEKKFHAYLAIYLADGVLRPSSKNLTITCCFFSPFCLVNWHAPIFCLVNTQPWFQRFDNPGWVSNNDWLGILLSTPSSSSGRLTIWFKDCTIVVETFKFLYFPCVGTGQCYPFCNVHPIYLILLYQVILPAHAVK